MDNPADTLNQTDEDILTYTVSDDALEAAADMEKLTQTLINCPPTFSVMCLAERKTMDDINTTDTLDADEAILTYTVSDEAIEAAAGGWGTTPICTSVAVPCPTSEFPCLTSTVSDEAMEAAADTEKSPVRPARR